MWARVGVQCTAAVPPSWSPVCWPHTRKASLGLAALCCCPTAVFSWSLSLPTAPRSPLLDRGPWACGAEPFQWKRHFEWGARASGPPQAAVCSAGTHGWRPPRTHARSAWRARARSRPSGPRGSPAVRGARRPLGHSSSHVVRLVGVRRISLVTCGGGPFPGWGSLRNESPAPGLLGWQPNPRHDTEQMSRAAVCSTPVVTARRREHGNKPGAVGGGPGPWRRCGHVGSSAGWQRTDTCRSGISRSWAWSPR